MNKIQKKIEESKDEYLSTTNEGNISLVDKVVSILEKNFLPKDLINRFTSDLDIRLCEGRTLSVQRFLINKYWRYQLVNLTTKETIDTTDSRFALIEDGSLVTWLELFEYNVLPIIKINGLPKY